MKNPNLSFRLGILKYLLMEAEDSSDAIAKICRLLKAEDSKFSLAFICKKLGMSSTGYLSDVIKGKRVMHEKYLDSFLNLIGLHDYEGELLKTMAAIDKSKKDDERDALISRREKIKHLISIPYESMPTRLENEDVFYCALIFSAFSLFNGQPTFKDIKNHFADTDPTKIDHTLKTLINMGLIKIEKDRYSIVKDRVLFSDSEDGLSHLDFLKQSLTHSLNHIDGEFPKTKTSNFTSTIISVNRDEYEAKLRKIKQTLLDLQIDLDAKDSDGLVHFNVQIYPL